jgi:hypothetical protein
MAVATLPSPLRNVRPGRAALALGVVLLALALAVLAQRLFAQVEGDRGILPMAISSDIEVDEVEVETTGKTAEEARLAGWKQAQKLGWAKLGGPAMADGVIEGMVVAVVIEREQIGPHRYIAKLGVIFDRERAGQYLGGGGERSHSAPLLTIPVLYSGGVAQVYEIKGPWQRAWAEFRASGSAIDYVRPAGSGGDSLLITAGQPGRRSRSWWRNVLDQFGASDVIVPVARLERQWPGGPVRGTFTARYGPDSRFLASFDLSANDEAGVPAMLATAVTRMDGIFTQALGQGLLTPDATLNSSRGQIDAALAAIIANGRPTPVATETPKADTKGAASDRPSSAASEAPRITSVTIQFATPDAGSVDAALSAVRGAPGVQSASTTSLAIGGTSVMRVSFSGDPDALAAALRARGYSVSGGGSSLSIRR